MCSEFQKPPDCCLPANEDHYAELETWFSVYGSFVKRACLSTPPTHLSFAKLISKPHSFILQPHTATTHPHACLIGHLELPNNGRSELNS